MKTLLFQLLLHLLLLLLLLLKTCWMLKQLLLRRKWNLKPQQFFSSRKNCWHWTNCRYLNSTTNWRLTMIHFLAGKCTFTPASNSASSRDLTTSNGSGRCQEIWLISIIKHHVNTSLRFHCNILLHFSTIHGAGADFFETFFPLRSGIIQSLLVNKQENHLLGLKSIQFLFVIRQIWLSS